MTVPDSTTLEPAELTVSAFVRAGSSPGTYKYVVSKGALQCYSASYGLDTGPTAGMYFYISNGSQVVRSPDAGPGIWDGRWHWIVGTFDGATVRLYVDRVQVGDGTPTDVALQYGLPDNERFYVGDYRGTCTAPHGFTGSIDAPFVLRRAVSPERD